jgi:hypothetical protein
MLRLPIVEVNGMPLLVPLTLIILRQADRRSVTSPICCFGHEAFQRRCGRSGCHRLNARCLVLSLCANGRRSDRSLRNHFPARCGRDGRSVSGETCAISTGANRRSHEAPTRAWRFAGHTVPSPRSRALVITSQKGAPVAVFHDWILSTLMIPAPSLIVRIWLTSTLANFSVFQVVGHFTSIRSMVFA